LHTAPLAPHWLVDSCDATTHARPLQQPMQLVELHAPPTHAPFSHVAVPAHALHAAAPVPHIALDCWVAGIQTLALQHPVQFDALQPGPGGVGDEQLPSITATATAHRTPRQRTLSRTRNPSGREESPVYCRLAPMQQRPVA
jgi:hypothetical protein